MAREAVKRHFGRPAYLLATTLALGVLFRYWEPMPQLLWRTSSPLAAILRYGGLALAAWSVATTGARSFLGLAPESGYKTSGPYRWLRHPMMFGTLVFLWAQDSLSHGRLLFNFWMTVYVAVATRWENRDLARRYLEARLPMQ